MKIRLGTATWSFYFWPAHKDPDESLSFFNEHAALAWLHRFRSDPMAMMKLRLLAATTVSAITVSHGNDDDRMIEALAFKLLHGSLHVAPIFSRDVCGMSQPTAAASVTPSSPPPQQASSPPPSPQKTAPVVPPDPDTFSSALDAASTAAVLCAAAKNGVPFCEECARAAAAAAAAAGAAAAA